MTTTSSSTLVSLLHDALTGGRLFLTPRRIGTSLSTPVLALSRLGLLLPLAAASAVSLVSLHATGGLTPWAALLAFLCVYSSYLIDHLSEVDSFEEGVASARSKMLASRRLIGMGGAAAYLLALGITGWQSGLGAVLMLLSFPVAVVFYCMPLVPFRKAGGWQMVRMKDIPGFKAVYTAFFWGWLMSFALVFHHTGTLVEHVAFSGFMFLSFIVNTVLCDFKDLERDRLEGVPTLPLMLGAERTFKLLQGVSTAAGFWLMLGVALQWLPLWCLALLITRVYASTLLHAGRTGRLDLTNSGEAWADFEFVLWLPAALGAAFLAN